MEQTLILYFYTGTKMWLSHFISFFVFETTLMTLRALNWEIMLGLLTTVNFCCRKYSSLTSQCDPHSFFIQFYQNISILSSEKPIYHYGPANPAVLNQNKLSINSRNFQKLLPGPQKIMYLLKPTESSSYSSYSVVLLKRKCY